MVGMSKKRKFGSPANKSVVTEEEVCGIGQVMREDGSRKVTGRQIDSKDTKDTTGDRTGGYRRKAGYLLLGEVAPSLPLAALRRLQCRLVVDPSWFSSSFSSHPVCHLSLLGLGTVL